MKKETKKVIKKLVWVERLALLASVIFFIWFTVFHILEKEKSAGAGKTDFAVFYAVGKIVAQRPDMPIVNIYQRKELLPVIREHFTQKGGTVFIYPPPSVIVLIPYSFLPFTWATYAWALTSALCVIAAYLLTISVLLNDRITRFRYSMLLFGLTFTDTIHGIFSSGQINALIFALMICGLAALIQKKERLAGFFLATVTVIKIFPGIFFPYLLIKKQWKAAASFAATGIGWFMIALPIFGTSGMMRFFTVKLPKILTGDVGYAVKSTSLYGSLLQHTKVHTVDSFFPFLVIAILSIVFYLIWKRRTIMNVPQVILDYGMLLLIVLLLSKAIHPAFHIWIIPAALYWIRRITKKSTWIDWMLALIACVALLFTQFWKIMPYTLHSTYLGLKPATAGMLLLLILTALTYITPLRKHFFTKCK